LGDPNHYYNVSAFVLQPAGTVGNLGRDTVIGPGSFSFDFGLVKETPFGEGKAVQFRAEVFNATNRANFGSPSTSVFTNATGIPSATAGRISSTFTTSRQIQLAMKVVF
jgi:hypothetical protein